jgi:hypothetical protein
MLDATPNFIQLLSDVAKRSQKLGYKINHVSSKHPQIELAYDLLKVVIDDSTIDATFYMEDTIYHKNNNPGFPPIPTPLSGDKILEILTKLKQVYSHVVELHKKILNFGEKIDDLQSRIKMIGVVDRSGGNYADNLLSQNPSTQSDSKQVQKREIASHLTKPIALKFRAKYLNQLKRVHPELFHLLQLRQAREAIQQTGEAKITTQTTVTRPKPMVIMSKDLERKLPPQLTPTQKIEAALTYIDLRKFIVKQSISPAKRQRNKFTVDLQLVPRQRKATAISRQDIQRLRNLLSHHTKYKFQFSGLSIAPKYTNLTFEVSTNRR